MLIISPYLCVGVDAMEGICGRIDCSFKEKGVMC